MDLTQAVLLSTIVVLTIFLVVIGFQAFFTLKDLRKSLTKFNKLIEDADELVSDVKKPVNTVTSLFTALTAGAGIAHIIKKIKQLDDKR